MLKVINLDILINSIWLIAKAILTGIAVNFIRKKIADKVRRRMLPFYQRSDLWHKTQHGFNLWIKLDNDIEVSFQISTPDDENQSQIAIRNIGKSKVEAVSINVVAEKCFDGVHRDYLYERQERVEITNLSSEMVVKQYLKNIPRVDTRVDIWFEEGTSRNRIIQSYQGLSIHLLSKKKNGIQKKCNTIIKPIFCDSSIDDLERGNWVARWGKFYNVRLLNQLKQDFMIKMYFSLNRWPWKGSRSRSMWPPEESQLKFSSISSFQIMQMRIIRPFMIIFIHYEKLRNLLFWIYLISDRIKLDEYE
jgi:hypothetical protein